MRLLSCGHITQRVTSDSIHPMTGSHRMNKNKPYNQFNVKIFNCSSYNFLQIGMILKFEYLCGNLE